MRLQVSDFTIAAERATGLSAWGDQDFRAGLQVLLDSAATDGQLSEGGWQRLCSRIERLLRTRLQLLDYRARHPAIAAEKIARPIFILGLPRSGTSNLLSLLAADPAHRVPRTWEMYSPFPPPQRETYEADPRIEEVQRFMDGDGFNSKELQKAHPFNARLPEECGYLWEYTFATMAFGAFFETPAYQQYSLSGADWHGVYGFHRQFLQHLQSEFRGERWVLKTPEHGFHLEGLLATYPDAILLYTHRDPAKVLPSLTSNIIELRKLWADPATVDAQKVARWVLELQAEGVRRVMAARDNPEINKHFYDLDFFELTQNPLPAIEKLYRHFDLPFTEAARTGIANYVDNEAKKTHGHGGHSYSLEEYGYDVGEIDTAFGEYLRRHRVPTVRRAA